MHADFLRVIRRMGFGPVKDTTLLVVPRRHLVILLHLPAILPYGAVSDFVDSHHVDRLFHCWITAHWGRPCGTERTYYTSAEALTHVT